jgi:hypothetical protein
MKKLNHTKYYQRYLHTGYMWAVIISIMLFLTSCFVYEETYTTTTRKHACELMERGDMCLSDHRCCKTQEHSTIVYYHNELPYWGFYSGYYYYYGVPHYYPWWYYYTIIPHYNYGIHTHVHIYCDNGYYVDKPRGTRFNNSKGRTYRPNKTVTVKSNRGNNRTIIKTNTNRTNTNRTNVKVNTNRNRTNVKTNTNRTNVKVNTNRNRTNVKINRTNSNKSNNKTYNNRSNKTNNRKNTRKPR